MSLEVVEMKKWQSRILNKVAWLIGIRGEDVWCMTLTKGFAETLRKEERDEGPL